MASTLFSIGHGRKSPEEFLNELLSFNIRHLVDARSVPYSKWAPQFNMGNIEGLLRPKGIAYVYMGDSIGGRPLDESCYGEDGRCDYGKMALVPRFKEGLLRLVKADQAGCLAAVMCGESDPCLCHRSKLIGRELYFRFGIDMRHILAPGKAVTESEILSQLTKGRWAPEQISLSGMEDFSCPAPFFKSSKVFKKADGPEKARIG